MKLQRRSWIVAKLDAQVPLLGQGGEAAAADRGGGGSNGWGRTARAAGFQQVKPPLALRPTSPQLRRAVFVQASEVLRQKLEHQKLIRVSLRDGGFSVFSDCFRAPD